MAQETTALVLPNTVSIWSLITGPEASHWSRLLVCSHLNRSTRFALFCTCKAARDMMLVTADHAYVCPDDKVKEPLGGGPLGNQDEQLLNLDSLRAIRAALQTRGNLRTTLGLDFSTAALLTFALGVLEAGTTWLDELSICRPDDDDDQLSASVLANIGRCCPNLRVLCLQQSHGMPNPQFFPKLKELCVYPGNDNFELEHTYRSIAPYVKQLTELTIESLTPPLPTHLPLLLVPGTIATHLRTLHVSAILNDTGLGLLLQCAPALQELCVHEVRLESGTSVQAQAPWRLLRTNVLHLSSLARLPPAAGGLRVSVDNNGTLVCDIIAGSETAHLKGARLGWSYASIKPGADVGVEDQAAALRTCLSLLRACPPKDVSPYCVPRLCGWHMSRDVLLELRQLPQYSTNLTFAEDLVWLPQPAHLYNTLLRLLPDSIRVVVKFLHPVRCARGT